jgi:hypothetical protein
MLQNNPTQNVALAAECSEDATVALERLATVNVGVPAWAAKQMLDGRVQNPNLNTGQARKVYASFLQEMSQRSELRSEQASTLVNLAVLSPSPFNERVAQHLLNVIVPAWQAKSHFESLLLVPSAWTDRDVCLVGGNYGIANWVKDCVFSEHTPFELAHLSLKLRRVPVLDFSLLEKNRIDGIALDSIFGGVRNLVHRQHVKTHQVLQAMVQYCDQGSPEAAQRALQSAVRGTPLEGSSEIFQLHLYQSNIYVGGRSVGKAIDFISRLERNTSPRLLTPPTGLNEKLQTDFDRLANLDSPRGEEFFGVLQALNAEVGNLMHASSLGVAPALVKAIVWVDHELSNCFSRMFYEEQIGIHKRPWFLELLKFRELVACADKFDAGEFEDWLQEVEFSESRRSRELVGRRTLLRLKSLADDLTGTPSEDLRGMFLSAGSTDNFLGSISAQLMPASCRAAERLRAEELAGLERILR